MKNILLFAALATFTILLGGCSTKVLECMPSGDNITDNVSVFPLLEYRLMDDDSIRALINDNQLEALLYQAPDGTKLPYRCYRSSKVRSGVAPEQLLLFLHGAGERGNDNSRQLRHAAYNLIEFVERNELNAVILFPQCPTNGWWPELHEALAGLTTEEQCKFQLDGSQSSLSGISMGSFGGFVLIAEHPELFQRALLVCGGASPEIVVQAGQKPLWLWHGAKDDVVPVEFSHKAIQKLAEINADYHYSESPEAGHAVWEEAYSDYPTLKWLMTPPEPTNCEVGNTDI